MGKFLKESLEEFLGNILEECLDKFLKKHFTEGIYERITKGIPARTFQDISRETCAGIPVMIWNNPWKNPLEEFPVKSWTYFGSNFS